MAKEKYLGKYRNESNRLESWDYSSNGGYFITLCIQNRIEHFGKIVDGNMILSDLGKVANDCFLNIPKHYPFAIIDEFIIMPDHMHGIIFIDKDISGINYDKARSKNHQPYQKNDKFIPKGTSRSLGSIVRGYKIGVTKYANKNNINFKRQSDYFDYVIFNENMLNNFRNYIINANYEIQNTR